MRFSTIGGLFHYRFVFSKEADLIKPLTPEMIDMIHDKGYFKLISLPSRFTTDLETLKTLKVHRDIELTVNSVCNLKCQNYDSCRYNQHVYQYNYSNVNPSLTCAKCAPYEHSHILLSLEEIVEKYAPLGFTHYRFDEVIDSPQNSALTFFIHYFIKPEHQAQVYEFYITGRM